MLSLDAEEHLKRLEVKRGRAANTVAAYRRDLASYEAWLAGGPILIPPVTWVPRGCPWASPPR